MGQQTNKAKKNSLYQQLNNACFNGDLEEVKNLIENKELNINGEAESSYNPLFSAAVANHLKVVTYLLGKGAAPRIKKEFNKSLFHDLLFEEYQYDSSLIKILLEKGLSGYQTCNVFSSSLLSMVIDSAEDSKYALEIIEIIIENSKKCEDHKVALEFALEYSIQRGDSEIFKRILSELETVYYEFKNEKFLLTAVKYGNLYAFKELEKKGLEFNKIKDDAIFEVINGWEDYTSLLSTYSSDLHFNHHKVNQAKQGFEKIPEMIHHLMENKKLTVSKEHFNYILSGESIFKDFKPLVLKILSYVDKDKISTLLSKEQKQYIEASTKNKKEKKPEALIQKGFFNNSSKKTDAFTNLDERTFVSGNSCFKLVRSFSI